MIPKLQLEIIEDSDDVFKYDFRNNNQTPNFGKTMDFINIFNKSPK